MKPPNLTDNFAIYGAEKVDASRSASELKDSLRAMIYPMMPGVIIMDQSEKVVFATTWCWHPAEHLRRANA